MSTTPQTRIIEAQAGTFLASEVGEGELEVPPEAGASVATGLGLMSQCQKADAAALRGHPKVAAALAWLLT